MSRRHILKYERKRDRLLPREQFFERVVRNFSISSGLIGLSLVAGMLGYHNLEGMEWIDAFANASMILSGMGPLEPMKTWSGKLFAGCYALYSGLVLIIAMGILVAPIVHRMLHRFHLEEHENG